MKDTFKTLKNILCGVIKDEEHLVKGVFYPTQKSLFSLQMILQDV